MTEQSKRGVYLNCITFVQKAEAMAQVAEKMKAIRFRVLGKEGPYSFRDEHDELCEGVLQKGEVCIEFTSPNVETMIRFYRAVDKKISSART